ALHRGRARRELRGQAFDHDQPLEARRPHRAREVEVGHATAGELAHDLVSRARGDDHRRHYARYNRLMSTQVIGVRRDAFTYLRLWLRVVDGPDRGALVYDVDGERTCGTA